MKTHNGVARLIGVVAIAGMLLMSGGVMARLLTGPAGTGTTSISSSTCLATVSGNVPATFAVDDGDDIQFDYGISWSDTRSPGPPAPAGETHHFLLTISYSKASGDQTDEAFIVTSGNAGGLDTLSVTVLGVDDNGNPTITVTWTAEMYGACSSGTSGGGTMVLT